MSGSDWRSEITYSVRLLLVCVTMILVMYEKLIDDALCERAPRLVWHYADLACLAE